MKIFTADPYAKSFSSVFSAKELHSLHLFRYPEKDLKQLANFKKLETLILSLGSLVTLDGVEDLPSLKEVEISYLRNLVDVRALEKVKKLNYLEIVKTQKLTADDILEQIPTAVRHRHPNFHTDYKDFKAIPKGRGIGELDI